MQSSAQRKRFHCAPPLNVDPTEYHIRYYPSVDVLQYPWIWVQRGPEHTPPNVRCGTMDWGGFRRLKEDIALHGVSNPFIIEYYCKEYPVTLDPKRKKKRDEPCLAIRTGNNRAEVLHQLKQPLAQALFVVPREVMNQLPTGVPYEVLPINGRLEHVLDKLWTHVKRGTDEPIGPARAWRDSILLQNLIRNSKC